MFVSKVRRYTRSPNGECISAFIPKTDQNVFFGVVEKTELIQILWIRHFLKISSFECDFVWLLQVEEEGL